jgi:uncharacterized C2H2 Zn-finger protein
MSESELLCDICGKDFKTDKMYQRHMNKKTPCKKMIHTCTYCNQDFTKEKEYENHIYVCEPRLEARKKRREEYEARREERARERERQNSEFINRETSGGSSNTTKSNSMPDMSKIFNDDFFASVGASKVNTTNVSYVNGKKMEGGTMFSENMNSLMKLCMNPDINKMDGKELSDKINKYVNEMVRLSLGK